MAGRWSALSTLVAFKRLKTAARLKLARDLADVLGDGWIACEELLGSQRLAAVELHLEGAEPATFAAIPGGKFTMGLRPDERDELVGLLDEYDEGEVDDALKASLPVHSVRVKPLLFATHVMRLDAARVLSKKIAALEIDRGRIGKLDQPVHVVASEIASIVGTRYRLPSEAEWEWVAREGGTRSWTVDPYDWINYDWTETANAFGAVMTEYTEWVADKWHATHRGAPKTAKARPGKPGVIRGVHSGWQDHIEVIVTACAYRTHGNTESFESLRLARDLP